MSDCRDPTGKCDLLQRVTDTDGFCTLLKSRSNEEVAGLQDNSNRNCLILATRKKSIDVVAALLERFATNNSFINHKDIVECTALTYAAEFGFITIMEQLLQAGADPMTTDHFGDTPIIWAAKRGRSQSLKTFARFVKSLKAWELKDLDGLDARGWATKMGHHGVAALIGRIIHKLRSAIDAEVNQTLNNHFDEGDGEGILISVTEAEVRKKWENAGKPTQVKRPRTLAPAEVVEEPEACELERNPSPVSSQYSTQTESLSIAETPAVQTSSSSTEALDGVGTKRALIVFHHINNGDTNSDHVQELDEARRNLSRVYRRLNFDVVENSRLTLEEMTEDFHQIIDESDLGARDTTAVAIGILEFCRLGPAQRTSLLAMVSEMQSLIGKPKWLLDQGFAPPHERLHGGCAFTFSNSNGDQDINGGYLTQKLLASLESPGALDVGLDSIMQRVIEAVKLVSDQKANPQHLSFLDYSFPLF